MPDFGFSNTLSNGSVTLTNNNLTASTASTVYVAAITDMPLRAGKVQWEFVNVGSSPGENIVLGYTPYLPGNNFTWIGNAPINGVGYQSNGAAWTNDVLQSGAGASWASNNDAVITITLDFDTLTANFYLDGVLQFARSLVSGQAYAPGWSGKLGVTSNFVINQANMLHPVSGFRAIGDEDKYRIQIVGQPVTPLLIDPSQLPVNFWTKTFANGLDVVITAKDSVTKLPRQVLSHNIAGEKTEIWFQNPNLISEFDLYYGSGVAPANDNIAWRRSGDTAATDSNHAILTGEVDTVNANKLIDASGAKALNLQNDSNSSAQITGLNGIGLAMSYDGTGSQTTFLTQFDIGGAASNWSIYGVYLTPASGTDLTITGNFSTDRITAQHSGTTVTVTVSCSGQDRVFTFTGIDSTAWTTGNWFLGVVNDHSGGVMRCRLNGTEAATQSSVTDNITIRRLGVIGTNYRVIKLDHVGMRAFALTSAQLNGLYQMLITPGAYATYSDPAASGPVAVDPDAAYFDTAGEVASLSLAALLAPASTALVTADEATEVSFSGGNVDPGAAYLDTAGAAATLGLSALLSPAGAASETVAATPAVTIGVETIPVDVYLDTVGSATSVSVGGALVVADGALDTAGESPTLSLLLVLVPADADSLMVGESSTVDQAAAIAVADAFSATAAESPTVLLAASLLPDDAALLMVGSASSLSVELGISPQDAFSETAGESSAITGQASLSPSASASLTVAGSPGLLVEALLNPASSFSLTVADEATVFSEFILIYPQDGYLDTFSDHVKFDDISQPLYLANDAIRRLLVVSARKNYILLAGLPSQSPSKSDL